MYEKNKKGPTQEICVVNYGIARRVMADIVVADIAMAYARYGR